MPALIAIFRGKKVLSGEKGDPIIGFTANKTAVPTANNRAMLFGYSGLVVVKGKRTGKNACWRRFERPTIL